MTTYPIPTLGDKLYLTDPSTALTYLIRTYAIVPGNVVPILPNNVKSLSYQAAQHGSNADKLCQVITTDLQQLLQKNFPSCIPDVLVTYDLEEDGWYTVTMSASMQLNNQIYQADARHTVTSNNTVVLPNDQISYL